METAESTSPTISEGALKIKKSQVVMVPVERIDVHPDNRPLGINDEKIAQLKILIQHDGFDSSHPLVVRLQDERYQLVEGEHRFRAARDLGYQELPCVIRVMDDTEALIQLITGNIQSDNKPLEIGLNALKVTQANQGLTVATYAQRLGMSETSIRRYMHASEAFQFIKAQLPNGAYILEEVYKLEEIQRCAKPDWIWLHDLITERELSKNQVIEICQAIREIKTDNPDIYQFFDFTAVRQKIAQEIIQGQKTAHRVYSELLEAFETSYSNLDENITVYEYNVLHDQIDKEEVNLREWFISNLRSVSPLTKAAVLEVYKDALQLKRSSSKEEAERDANYFRDKKNQKEREEQERIEREMRQVLPGEWWQLGEHVLYCGHGQDEIFRNRLPEKSAWTYANFIKNDPEKQDTGTANAHLAWQQYDWLVERSQVVTAIVPTQSIPDFLQATQMPYKWSLSIKVNEKEGNWGSWLYAAVFSEAKSIRQATDSAAIKNAPNLAGYLPKDLLKYLIEAFSTTHDPIIDLEAGNGILLMLAEKHNRICYAAEADPEACKLLLDDWEKESGGKARKIDDAEAIMPGITE